MWLSPALLLLSLPGCFSLEGPTSVRGSVRGSLAVRCRYGPGWEDHKKYWCRGAIWHTCKVLVQTTRSEQEVRKDRVSLRDSLRDRMLTVTMEELRRDDQGTYWCGIERVGTDRGVRVEVTIDPEGTVVTTTNNLQSRTTANSHGGPPPGSNGRTHYMLLVFVKVPILLILVGAILWLKGSQRVPEDQWKQPICTDGAANLTMNTAA